MDASSTDMFEQRGQSLLDSLVPKSGDIGLGRIHVVKLTYSWSCVRRCRAFVVTGADRNIPKAQVDNDNSTFLRVGSFP